MKTISPKSTHEILEASTLSPVTAPSRPMPFICPSTFSYYFQVVHKIKAAETSHAQSITIK